MMLGGGGAACRNVPLIGSHEAEAPSSSATSDSPQPKWRLLPSYGRALAVLILLSVASVSIFATSVVKSVKKMWDPFTGVTMDADKMMGEDNVACGDEGASDELMTSGPYLYITFHGGKRGTVRNVCKYDLEGRRLGAVLLPSAGNSKVVPQLHKGKRVESYRGILLMDDGSLIVADAWRKNSRILHFSNCIAEKGNHRSLLSLIVDEGRRHDPPLIHPYGVALSKDKTHLYATSQATSQIISYRLPSSSDQIQSDAASHISNMPLGSEAAPYFHMGADAAQVFAEVKLPKIGRIGLRGVTVDEHGRIYVADERLGVIVYSPEGEKVATMGLEGFGIFKPVSVIYSSQHESIFVGCAELDEVIQVNVGTEPMTTVMHFRHPNLVHPVGVTTFGDKLYVISQHKNKVLRFIISEGVFDRVVMRDLPDRGENMILSPC